MIPCRFGYNYASVRRRRGKEAQVLAQRRMVVAGCMVLLAGSAGAQQPAPAEPAVPPPAPRPVTASLYVQGEMGFESDLSGAGRVATSRGRTGIDVGIPTGQYSQLNLGFDYEHSSYDFHGATGFVAGATSPFDDVDRETLSARFAQHLSQEFSYVVGARVFMSAEEGAKASDSLEGLVYVAPRYAFSDTFAIGLGVVVSTQLEDNALVLPVFVLDWDITKEWNLSNDGKLGLFVTYTPNEHWAFSLGGDYQYRDFRLDQGGPDPNGVGRDARVPVMLSATWTPDKRVSVQAGIGMTFLQQYELLDSSGNSIAKINADPAPVAMVRLGFKF